MLKPIFLSLEIILRNCAIKIIRANNLLQFIHQITIGSESPRRKRDLSQIWNLDYHIIVLSITFRKGFAKFMIPIAFFKKFLS